MADLTRLTDRLAKIVDADGVFNESLDQAPILTSGFKP